MKVSQRRAVGRAGLELTALGLGCAAFGGLYRPIAADDALRTGSYAKTLTFTLSSTTP